MTDLPEQGRRLVQIDGWTAEHCDDVIHADDDGDALTSIESIEQFTSPFAVRVFLEPGTDPAQAARMLRKIASWVEEGTSALFGDGLHGLPPGLRDELRRIFNPSPW